jgi:hypothetical protein
MVPESLNIAAAVFLPNFGAMLGQKLTKNKYRRDVWYKVSYKTKFAFIERQFYRFLRH